LALPPIAYSRSVFLNGCSSSARRDEDTHDL